MISLPWFVIHGLLMMSAFGFFTTLAVILAYYFRSVFEKYDDMVDGHLMAQLMGFLISVLGIIAIQMEVQYHMNTLHSMLGKTKCLRNTSSNLKDLFVLF